MRPRQVAGTKYTPRNRNRFRGGGGVPPVTPITLLGADALGWWTGDYTGLIARSGNQMTSWKDVVAGYDMTQAVGGSRPLYGFNLFNGAPAAFFDGIDDFMGMASMPFPSGSAPSEYWAIYQDDALESDAATRRLFNAGNTLNTVSRSLNSGGNGSSRISSGYTGDGVSQIGATGGATYASGTRHFTRLVITPTGIVMSHDGAPLGVETPGVSATAAVMARIGLANNGAGPWKGLIRDIVVTAPLSAPKVTAMNAWCENRRML